MFIELGSLIFFLGQCLYTFFIDLLTWFLRDLGQKYYYNTNTQATQWEPPTAVNPGVAPHAPTNAAVEMAAQNTDIWNSQMQRCLGCGGWGVGLVQPWGYCNHCTR